MEKSHNYRKISVCRLCRSKDLSSLINLGRIPLGNNLQEKENLAMDAEIFPLKVNRCNRCNHFQLSIAVDPKKLYKTNYTYLSRIGRSFVDHLNKYAKWAYKKFSLNNNSLVIDIGSNDGTCLKQFKNLGCKVVGIDPATKPAKLAIKEGIPTIIDFCNRNAVKEIIKRYGKADLITSHNALAHIDDFDYVFKNIFDLLKNEGYFIFEIGYFRNVLVKKCFDTIYHEHIDYHHANPLYKYMSSIGFQIIDFSTNEIQGGTLRITAKKTKDNNLNKYVKKFLDDEMNSILYENYFLNNWESKVNLLMQDFGKKIKKFKSQGFKVAGYGAPTKSSLLLSLANLSKKEISFIFEDNELKVGKYLPKLSIPIISSEEFQENHPDVVIIFAWNFYNEIIKSIKKRVLKPVSCIIPLPEIKIIEIE